MTTKPMNSLRWVACAAACAAVAVFSPRAFAESVWTIPGWYVVVSGPEGTVLWQGPFTGEAECLAALPEEEELEALYECVKFDTRPDWDAEGDPAD